MKNPRSSKGRTVREIAYFAMKKRNERFILRKLKRNLVLRNNIFKKYKTNCNFSRILKEECENETVILSSIVEELINDAAQKSENNTFDNLLSL